MTQSDTQRIVAEELQAFVDRRENLEREIKELQDAKKDLHAELKGRGFQLSAFNSIIARRKKDADDLANEDATVDMYKDALGMS